MTLYTKSITKPIEQSDGFRICIMRNPSGHEGSYDHWMPELSPKQSLRDELKAGLKWDGFKPKFEAYLETKGTTLDYVASAARSGDVTLLCVEDTPDRCHRSLVANAIKERHVDLEVVVR